MSTACVTAVFRHSASTGAARLVLLAMADEASSDGELTAYRRSQAALAAKANCDERTVGRAIQALVALGEVEVLSHGTGYAKSNYRLLLPGVGDTPTPVPATRPPGVGDTPTPSPRYIPVEDPNEDPPTPHGQQALAVVPASPPAVAAPPRPPRGGMDLTWQAFWASYPRKAGKVAARKAWDQALRRGVDPAVIVAGARRYAADPNRVAQYTAHPTTWLNQGRWDDDAEPARQARAVALHGAAGTMAAYRQVLAEAQARDAEAALGQHYAEVQQRGLPPLEGDDAAAVRALLAGGEA